MPVCPKNETTFFWSKMCDIHRDDTVLLFSLSKLQLATVTNTHLRTWKMASYLVFSLYQVNKHFLQKILSLLCIHRERNSEVKYNFCVQNVLHSVDLLRLMTDKTSVSKRPFQFFCIFAKKSLICVFFYTFQI